MPTHLFKSISSAQGPHMPLIAHIPHSQTFIGPDERAHILLSDEDLRRELLRLTDWHTDRLFSWVLALGGTTFVYQLSRLVLDPERFDDDAQEVMAAVGQGVVYTHTTDGRVLAAITPAERQRRIDDIYEPYHERLTALVRHMLDHAGECSIIDCHSFSSTPLPHEPDQRPDRPDICLGTHRFHTPEHIADLLERGFTAEGFRVARDTPFRGTFVPTEFLNRDPRVMSVMTEVRRGLYCDEATGEPLPHFADVRAALERVFRTVLGP